MEQLKEQLDRIEGLIENQVLRPLDLKEAAEYLHLAKQTVYGLVSAGDLSCFKPNGKKIYFNKADLDRWIFRHRQKSREEIARELEGEAQ